MASRLSENSLTAVYDTGRQGLQVRSSKASDYLVPPDVDLDELLLAEEPEAAVQALAPQAVYRALLRKGPEDCLDVLPLLADDQVTRIFDYDAWHEDRLVPRKVFRWLTLFKEVSDEEMFRRFRGLEEEYQLALLGPLVTLFDEDELEDLPQEEQDALFRLPCGTLFYRINTADNRIEEALQGLIEAALSCDINYAYSMLAHAASLPPAEQEALLAQFRTARLEEDGFVAYNDSLAVFQPLAPREVLQLRERWGLGALRQEAGVAVGQGGDKPFLTRVLTAMTQRSGDAAADREHLANITQGLARLSNTLAAAAKIETDDVEGLRQLLEQGQALTSLGLEYLAHGDVQTGALVLVGEHPQVLFRIGLGRVHALIEAVLTEMEQRGLAVGAKLLKQLRLDRRGALLSTLDQEVLPVLGSLRTETLKGVCNRLPLRPAAVENAAESAAQVRMIFEPIVSEADLRSLGQVLDGITGVLYLAALTSPPAEMWGRGDIDRLLLTALAQVLVGRAFRYERLSGDDVAQLLAMPEAAVQARLADFYAGVEGTLRLALMPGAGQAGNEETDAASWSASCRAGLGGADPAQPVMAELADLALRLAAARASARVLGNGPAALAGLLDIGSSGGQAN